MKQVRLPIVSTFKPTKHRPAGFYLRWNEIIREFDTSVLELDFISSRISRREIERLLHELRGYPDHYSPTHSHWCDAFIPLLWISMMLGISCTLMNFIFSLELAATTAVERVLAILLLGFCSILVAASVSFAHNKARSAARRSLFQPVIERHNQEVFHKLGLKVWLPEFENYLAFDFIGDRPVDLRRIMNRFGLASNGELAESKTCEKIFLLSSDEVVMLDSEVNSHDC